MRRILLTLLILLAILGSVLVLDFHVNGQGTPPQQRLPFANPVEQRAEIIRQLRQIELLLQQQNRLLQKQNELLESGKVKVVVVKSQ